MADGSTNIGTPDNASTSSVLIPRQAFHVLQNADPSSILQRWAGGETLRQIAASFQVSAPAMTQWLNRNTAREDREQAREQHYETKLDEGLEAMEAAADDVNLARAREPYLRRLEWRAQTECKRWQPKQQVTHELGPQLSDRLLQAQTRVSSAQQALQNTQIIDVTPEKES